VTHHLAATATSLAPAGSTALVTQTTVAVPTTDPGPDPAAGVNSVGLAGAIISGAFLAAMVAGAINVWMARRRSREEERARIRSTFAAAFEAYTAYKEFPYAIRRRRADDPEGERIRLSEALRAIQEKLSYYLAWTRPNRPRSASSTPRWSPTPAGSPAWPCMRPGTPRPRPPTPR
jgi:hypothetical protein